MKRKLLSLLLAVFTFAVVSIRLSSHAPIARAASPSSIEGAASCSLFNLAGRWGYTYSGTIVGLGPAASVGSFVEDGEGRLKGSQTRSFNGDVEDETLTGTITVNPDCTAQATVNVFLDGTLERTSVLNVVYVDNQRGLRAIFTTPSTVITIDGRKITTE